MNSMFLFLTNDTGAPYGKGLGRMKPLSCNSCISEGARRYGDFATGVAPGTKSMRNSTCHCGGHRQVTEFLVSHADIASCVRVNRGLRRQSTYSILVDTQDLGWGVTLQAIDATTWGAEDAAEDNEESKKSKSEVIEESEQRRLGAGPVKCENVAADEKESIPSKPEFYIEAGSVGNVARLINNNFDPNLFV
ncbi:hypothetical protein Tco_0156473 [Tanacetum coccineum]